MELEVLRYNHDKESTSGLLAVDMDFEAFTLEDQKQLGAKIAGETRIPEGKYKLGIRKVDSPLTKKYRERYDWFKYHIQILGVPGFDYVYIHVGNKEIHTDACLLIADRADNDPGDFAAEQWLSAQAYERFYKWVYPFLDEGGDADITFKSIWE